MYGQNGAPYGQYPGYGAAAAAGYTVPPPTAYDAQWSMPLTQVTPVFNADSVQMSTRSDANLIYISQDNKKSSFTTPPVNVSAGQQNSNYGSQASTQNFGYGAHTSTQNSGYGTQTSNLSSNYGAYLSNQNSNYGAQTSNQNSGYGAQTSSQISNNGTQSSHQNSNSGAQWTSTQQLSRMRSLLASAEFDWQSPETLDGSDSAVVPQNTVLGIQHHLQYGQDGATVLIEWNDPDIDDLDYKFVVSITGDDNCVLEFPPVKRFLKIKVEINQSYRVSISVKATVDNSVLVEEFIDFSSNAPPPTKRQALMNNPPVPSQQSNEVQARYPNQNSTHTSYDSQSRSQYGMSGYPQSGPSTSGSYHPPGTNQNASFSRAANERGASSFSANQQPSSSSVQEEEDDVDDDDDDNDEELEVGPGDDSDAPVCAGVRHEPPKIEEIERKANMKHIGMAVSECRPLGFTRPMKTLCYDIVIANVEPIAREKYVYLVPPLKVYGRYGFMISPTVRDYALSVLNSMKQFLDYPLTKQDIACCHRQMDDLVLVRFWDKKLRQYAMANSSENLKLLNQMRSEKGLKALAIFQRPKNIFRSDMVQYYLKAKDILAEYGLTDVNLSRVGQDNKKSHMTLSIGPPHVSFERQVIMRNPVIKAICVAKEDGDISQEWLIKTVLNSKQNLGGYRNSGGRGKKNYRGKRKFRS